MAVGETLASRLLKSSISSRTKRSSENQGRRFRQNVFRRP
ncbi:hypothetical protein NEIMUCOT_05119 [Neisseria mucosa ATCC 25996]|uniref:Uncharacterized protein n=1 Tax=Neisseria mucosa (strain ATCC 25996 / DSM 4631 / NCTC 10774 / M26) TaxID=546266 RepID=D2ZWX1_NEIM2|nr:hypothetical protein NEIMUCOT_05119 [Neisseria mucosa ATCC 25996]